jgi:hypothetical protein
MVRNAEFVGENFVYLIILRSLCIHLRRDMDSFSHRAVEDENMNVCLIRLRITAFSNNNVSLVG